MMKVISSLFLISASLAYVAYRAQQAAIQALPTAEHKKRVQASWDAEDRRRREALSA
jgi:hypothetical protein